MRETVPVIDLFAGPGGLGEGFTSFVAPHRTRGTFKIAVSVEKDAYAHKTLLLRSFFRQFLQREVPPQYYQHVRGTISLDDLFAAFPVDAAKAKREARCAELGNPRDDTNIYRWIDQALGRSRASAELNLSVLIGGPPCQAYSMAGRARRKGDPTFKMDEKHTLYREYLRILGHARPAVFVMENVKGLLSSKLEDMMIFQRMAEDLKHPEAAAREAAGGEGTVREARDGDLTYRIYSLVVSKDNPDELDPYDFVIEAEKYGIPQTRHRVILLGVRNDIAAVPKTLLRHPEMVPACRVLSDLPALRSSLSNNPQNGGRKDSEANWRQAISEVLGRPWLTALHEDRPNLFAEFQEDLQSSIRVAVANVQPGLTIGSEFIEVAYGSGYRPDWYSDASLNGVCNHTTRGHMIEDLHRYLFAACYAQVYGNSPKMRNFPTALLPKHENIQKARDKGEEEVFDDRFRVQVIDRPATTITSHIHKDGHYNIHFDPTQCRSLTVREAARLQTFPDNYFFEGPRTEQYKQVGNAVPPLLAHQIAGVVHDLFEQINATRRTRYRPLPGDSSQLVEDQCTRVPLAP
jgi:DNA (cytosine-5)-methyltransferase 1